MAIGTRIGHLIFTWGQVIGLCAEIIITIWRTLKSNMEDQKENLRIGYLKYIVLKKLSEYREFIQQLPNQRFEKLANDLSSLDTKFLLNL